jgi:hypothetical protein
MRGAVLHVKQSKTGARLEIPVDPKLQAIIEATPSDQLTFLTTHYSRPFHPVAFSIWFRAACDQAGLSHCSALACARQRRAVLPRLAVLRTRLQLSPVTRV